MSAQIRELLNEAYAAINARNFPGPFAEHIAPEFEWIPNPDDLEQRPRRSIAEIQAALDDLWESLEGLESEIEDLQEHGGSYVVSVHHVARGRGSGAVVERREVHVWTFEDDKVIRLAEFRDLDAALAALDG